MNSANKFLSAEYFIHVIKTEKFAYTKKYNPNIQQPLLALSK